MTENERQPVRTFTVDETAAGERLDKFLSTVCPDLTRSAAARVIEEGGVLLDGSPGNKKDKLRPGTRVELRLPEPKPMEVLPEHIPLDVVYEDDDLLVVNKPKGMVVHPAPGNYTGTLVNALLYYCGDSLSGLGNLIDRVLYGYVIDFIEPTFMQFAVFNIADCAVTCGGISFVLWLAVDLFRSGDGKKGTTHDGK